MNNNLMLRILSSLFLIPLLLISIWIGGYLFFIILSLLSILILYEFNNLIQKKIEKRYKIFLLLSLFSVFINYYAFIQHFYELLVLSLVFILVIALSNILFNSKNQWYLFAFLYSLLPSVILIVLRQNKIYGFEMVLMVFLVTWISDTSAYFMGKLIGGPKLAPRISPNKTISGAFFGILISTAVLSVLFYDFFASYTLMMVIFFSLLSFLSIIGDLFASFLKRYFKSDESSNLIPGHGGFIDRADSLIGVALGMAILLFLLVVFFDDYKNLSESFLI
ncbi:MAG: phosphatidate cytidylyltransferase [Alphaproteobacteria bacterium]|jgi:phosphatidate cytidylyltransferase|tara:strand:+ start:685 stop:1518 length:834 start_codon:yes stop_codon:yes gene_type:complete